MHIPGGGPAALDMKRGRKADQPPMCNANRDRKSSRSNGRKLRRLFRCHKRELKTPSTILAPTSTSNVTAMRRKLRWNFGMSSAEANIRAGHNFQDVKQNRLTAIANTADLAIM